MFYIIRQIVCRIIGHHVRPYFVRGDAICRRCDAMIKANQFRAAVTIDGDALEAGFVTFFEEA